MGVPPTQIFVSTRGTIIGYMPGEVDFEVDFNGTDLRGSIGSADSRATISLLKNGTPSILAKRMMDFITHSLKLIQN
jgi:hypothetical protein